LLFCFPVINYLTLDSTFLSLFTVVPTDAIRVTAGGRRGQMEPLLFILFIKRRQQYRKSILVCHEMPGHAHVLGIDRQ